MTNEGRVLLVLVTAGGIGRPATEKLDGGILQRDLILDVVLEASVTVWLFPHVQSL